MSCGQARLCVRLCVSVSVCLSVCLSAAAWLHYCTDPDVTWWSGRGCHLVVRYWADLQSVHGLLRCYGNSRNAWQSLAVICQAHRTHYACWRRLPSPAIKSTRLLRARRYLQRGRSISSILRGVVMRTRNVSEYMLVLALCLVGFLLLVSRWSSVCVTHFVSYFCNLHQGGYVFVVVCLSVFLLATLRKNVRTNFREIFREDWQ